MSGIVTGGKENEEAWNKIGQYFNDLYAGKIPIPCDDNCPEDCEGHGNYMLLTEFRPLFNEVEA